MAELVHEIMRTFCNTIGDDSILSWKDSPSNIQASALNGVELYLNHPNITPEQIHDNWRKFKLDDGWVYGKVKDSKKKTHTCIVDYKDLPTEQQIKDSLFINTMKALTGV